MYLVICGGRVLFFCKVCARRCVCLAVAMGPNDHVVILLCRQIGMLRRALSTIMSTIWKPARLVQAERRTCVMAQFALSVFLWLAGAAASGASLSMGDMYGL